MLSAVQTLVQKSMSLHRLKSKTDMKTKKPVLNEPFVLLDGFKRVRSLSTILTC